MALKFLLTKSFHPATKSNQRRVWIAEQKQVDQKKREEESKKQFEAEQNYWGNRQFIGLTDKEVALKKQQRAVAFMYQAPPGYLGKFAHRKESNKSAIQEKGQKDK
jgi:CBF1 interacting corepressor